jgi:hypothetical protein
MAIPYTSVKKFQKGRTATILVQLKGLDMKESVSIKEERVREKLILHFNLFTKSKNP